MNGFSKPTEPKPAEAPKIEIKTMPERFYVKKMKVTKGPKTALLIVMVLIILGLMAGAAYLFTKSLEKEKGKKPVVPANIANAPLNAPPVNVPSVNVPPPPVCGNGVCETGEDSKTCPRDCPPPPPPSPICGNGVCESGESSESCPQDCPPPPRPPILPSASDQDKDGLTDEEEKVFSTDVAKPDTDGDGYVDGLEVINLYNPIGFAPVRIEDSGLVLTYTNPTFNYSILYPKVWMARGLDETNREVLFTSATGEFVQVIVEENLEHLPVLDWYLAKSPGMTAAEVHTVVTKTGLQGIQSPDGLTAYFSYGDYIFAIAYNVGTKTELNFKTTFEMMVRSFKL